MNPPDDPLDRDPLGPIDLEGAGDESEYPDFHRSTRMPLDAVVRLHFEGTVAYQNGFAANVSATGMYVKHPDPPPVGTRLVFELVLGEERKPVQGAGLVAWTREKYEGPGRPAGVGIQYTEIDALSRQHIAEALFSYLETQLGDELAENQDAVDLVATSRTRTSIEMVESIGRDEEFEREATTVIPVRAAEPAPPFDADDDLGAEAEPTLAARPRFEVQAERHGAAVGGLFTPAIPPDEAARAGASESSRSRSPWPAIAVGVALAAAGFAGWWFLAGPGSIGEPGPVVASRPARETAKPESAAGPAAEPASESGTESSTESGTESVADPVTETGTRETLDPSLGPATTLAQAVGAGEVKAPGPLPVDETGAPAAVQTDLIATDAEPPAPPAGTDPAVSAGAREPSSSATAPLAAEPIAPAPSATPPVAASRATRVSSIRWEVGDSSTVVVLTGDGEFAAGSFKWNEIRDANPRVLLRLTSMAAGYPKSLLAAGTPELKQVRVGFHEKSSGNELHIVLDLGAANVRVDGVEASGNRLTVRLATR